MTPMDKPPNPTDEELVAFLDGELDPAARSTLIGALIYDGALRERLGRINRASSDLKEAFAPLLDEAPKEKLEAGLATLSTDRVPWMRWRGWRIAAMAAAAIFLFVAGIVVDRSTEVLGPLSPQGEEAHEAGWRDAVAGYFSLYTDATFAGATAEGAGASLELVGSNLDLNLTPAKITLPGLQFVGAQQFGYENEPLAQIAYIDPDTGPMAFCIVAADQEGEEPPVSESRMGMNVVYWAKGHFSFMLIGRASPEKLEHFAQLLRQRL